MNPPARRTPSLNLDETDFVASDPARIKRAASSAMVDEIADFKMAGRNNKCVEEVLTYFQKYPDFASGLMSSKHLQKLCTVIERTATRHVDKKAVALVLAERIAGRPLTNDEKTLFSNSIEFLHKNGLIKATFVQRMWILVKRIFR